MQCLEAWDNNRTDLLVSSDCPLKFPIKCSPNFDRLVGCWACQPLAIWTELDTWNCLCVAHQSEFEAVVGLLLQERTTVAGLWCVLIGNTLPWRLQQRQTAAPSLRFWPWPQQRVVPYPLHWPSTSKKNAKRTKVTKNEVRARNTWPSTWRYSIPRPFT